ncbi:hypothetical protein [Kibdelosporangium aridum]|uniref:hypothetical protein n=1 Tax=Kibdelosporangium aridum TaxID=2030 RepID=UPI00055B66D3|nr:hypothetical protein [Kibdelosporangium aridum]
MRLTGPGNTKGYESRAFGNSIAFTEQAIRPDLDATVEERHEFVQALCNRRIIAAQLLVGRNLFRSLDRY